MSRLSRQDDEILLHTLQTGLLAGLGNVTAPASLTSTSGAVTVSYSSNNPAITPTGTVTIANGSSVTAAENHRSLVELDVKAAAMRVDISNARTALVSLIASGVRGSPSCAAMTTTAPTATNQHVGVTYTSNNPSITPDNAITIANGASVTAAELHQAFVELNKEAFLVWQDISRIHFRIKRICDSRLFWGLTALPAQVSNATIMAITYTTGNPSITPNAAVTVSNGSSVTAAENWELAVELKDQLEKIRADALAVYTALNTFLTKAGVA